MGKKIFIILKIIIAIVSLSGSILCKFNVCNILQDWTDILFDICIGVFASMVLVFFIDEISKHIQERQSRQDELEYIKRFNNILELYIDQYIMMYYCVATPLKSRTFDNVKMPENFKIKDMSDLHEQTLLINKGFFGSSVDGFLKVELILRNELISLIERYNFIYYPQFVKIFTEYIEASLNYDCREAINDSSHMMKNDDSYKKTIFYLMENDADNFYLKMKIGEQIFGNIVHPYIYLYEMMNLQRKTILDYRNEIVKTFEQITTKKKNKKRG